MYPQNILVTCNQYKMIKYFTLFFGGTSSLKFGVHFALTGHLNSD